VFVEWMERLQWVIKNRSEDYNRWVKNGETMCIFGWVILIIRTFWPLDR
jgi:hypothetical protein